MHPLPSSDAKLISDWRIEVEEYNSPSRRDENKEEDGHGGTRFRVVALDGTYAEAKRMMNFLRARLDAKGVPAPVVKLNSR